MVPLMSLWMPIVVAAVLVFLMSSVIHMFLTYHRSDFSPVSDENGVMDALRPFGLPPGEYVVPHAGSPAAMKSDEYQGKVNTGPVFFMTVFPNGMFNMGKSLMLWFVYSLVVGVFCALVAGTTIGPGADYRVVFHIVALTAFAGYVLAGWQNTVWYNRKVSTSLKNSFDGALYALLTAGAFGWLWPV